jgi:hypothetical protein
MVPLGGVIQTGGTSPRLPDDLMKVARNAKSVGRILGFLKEDIRVHRLYVDTIPDDLHLPP